MYHKHGFIICNLCKSAIPWNYLCHHLDTEWIFQPIYALGSEVAHDLQLLPSHRRSFDGTLEDSIQREIGKLVKNPKFLTSEQWVKVPKTQSAVEGIAMFEGVYCSNCKKSVQGSLEKIVCKCGNPLEPSIVQCLAYHWNECKQWFQISTLKTPSAKPSTIGTSLMSPEQLIESKLQAFSNYMTVESPSISPVLIQLGLDNFCQMMWKHPSFPSIWNSIKQFPKRKQRLQKLVFRTAMKDYDQLTTGHTSLKQLIFSNRRSVPSSLVLGKLDLNSLFSLA